MSEPAKFTLERTPEGKIALGMVGEESGLIVAVTTAEFAQAVAGLSTAKGKRERTATIKRLIEED